MKGVRQSKCQIVPPVVGVWYAKTVRADDSFWIISGQVPLDLVNAKMASNAREAMRYFSMSWQLKAAHLEDAIVEGKIPVENKKYQENIARELASKAERISSIYNESKFWRKVAS